MRLLHDLAKIQATFDEPNLVSRAGLVPVMALAQRAGLAALAGEHVRPGGRCGVNAQMKVGCLVAGMIGAADSRTRVRWSARGEATKAYGRVSDLSQRLTGGGCFDDDCPGPGLRLPGPALKGSYK